ncbi:hypothetical protein HDV02_004570 [Globomyces sp. JEL0801]|nr:hypothetical protein HDV02_004570 [Globomyces sp. JEL0801]
MIHELLLTLAGHHGDLFNSDFDVDPNFPYLHQSEIILLGTLAKLGLNYSKIKSFICKYQSTNRIPIFKLGLVQSIDLWLKEYDSILVQLEMDSMKGDCTITLINYRLEIYHILFRDLLDFIEHIENDNSLVGVRLLNYLHIRLSTNGVPQLSDMDSYELDSSQFPNFLPVSVVENCFLIGRVVLVLKKNPDTQSLIEKYRKVFDYHSKSAELDYNILEIDINSFKSEIVQILFTSVTIKNQISYPLHSFRQIYLMGQGDFNDEFIEQCWELKKKSDLALLPTSEREFNRLFKRIAEDYLHDEWAKFSLPNFEFIDVQKDYTGPIEFPKYLNYNVTWPFDLFVNSKDIESYNKLFSFFLSIKISIKKLVQIRKSIMTPQTPKLLWIMCSSQLFFFESLWSYIQMDLIDSQYGELVTLTLPNKERDQSVSIEDLSRKHEQVLKTLLSGCFLNDSKSSKLINENIVDIIKLSLKTCQLIEQSQQQGQYNLLMLQDINKDGRDFTFRFSSMSDPYALLAEADKKSKTKGWFGGNKMDEAAELFGRAANAFKLQKKFKESGDAFMQQGVMLEKIGERDEASGCYINASKSYKKEFPKGRFSSAASNQKQIAEIYETDIVDYQKAGEAYELAAEWYAANGCLLKVAHYAALAETYDKAIEIYEKVATKSLDNNLTKWSVREYLFKAMICVLCLNVSLASVNIRIRSDLRCALVESVEEGDLDAYSGALQEFDKMTKLDEWKTSLLLRVKKSIQAQEEDYT